MPLHFPSTQTVGEVVGVEISSVSANVLLRNATAHCLESVHVVAYGKVLCL